MIPQASNIYLPGAENTLVRLLRSTSRLNNLYSNSHFPKAYQEIQAQSVTFGNTGRLMRVRWWLSRARFIKKAGCNGLFDLRKTAAKYLCLRCGYRWSEHHSNIPCPKCGHLYIEWLNYDEVTQSCQINRTTPHTVRWPSGTVLELNGYQKGDLSTVNGTYHSWKGRLAIL